jgi:hypothetical protein
VIRSKRDHVGQTSGQDVACRAQSKGAIRANLSCFPSKIGRKKHLAGSQIQSHAGSVQLRNLKGRFTVQCQLSFVERQKVAHITRHESQSALGAARFQRDRGFGFQPNVKRSLTLRSGAALTASETLTIIDFALSLNADKH